MEHSLNILLADDEEIVHKTVAGYLRDSGHHVDKAYNAYNVLKAIERDQYDLALVDIRMPDMDGLSLLTKIKETCPEMPVIIITGCGNMDMAIESLRLGASDFLTKPIKLLELDAVLEKSTRLYKLAIQRSQAIEEMQRVCGELEARGRERALESERVNEKLRIEITGLKEALRQAERRYLLLTETISDVVWETDMNLRFTYMSPAVTSMLGYSVEEMMTLAWEEVLTERSAEVFEKAFAEELASEDMRQKYSYGSRTVNMELTRDDGSIVRAETTFSLLYDPDSRPAGILGVSREIDRTKG